MNFFLLDYDHATGEVNIRSIEDRAEALAAYSQREGEALGTSHEVVLFYGESADDLRKTHSRYFFKRTPPGEGERIELDEFMALMRKLAPADIA